MAKEIHASDFEAAVLNNEKPVVVDFWAVWCGPCQMMGPLVERMAAKYTDIDFCKVNVDEEPQLAMRFGIDAIPCLMLFRGGKIAGRAEGYMPEEMLVERLGL